MAILEGDAILVLSVGLFLTAMGVLAIVDPKIQGARDVNIIEAEEVGPAEKLASRLGGLVLLAMGLFVVSMGVYVEFVLGL